MDKEKVTPTEQQNEVTEEKTELESLREELETLQKAKDELYDKYLRTLAEYDNFRKRSQREKDAIYGDATVDAVKKLLPVLDNFKIRVNKTNCGNSSEADDDFRIDKADLLLKPLAAGGNFVFRRVAVLRRTAFYHVSDIDIFFAGKVNNGKHFIKKHSAPSDKRFAFKVFVFAGTFTDEKDVCIRISDSENNVCSCFAKSAFFAVEALSTKFIKGHKFAPPERI